MFPSFNFFERHFLLRESKGKIVQVTNPREDGEGGGGVCFEGKENHIRFRCRIKAEALLLNRIPL